MSGLRRLARILVFALFVFVFAPVLSSASPFYLHDSSDYWWYIPTDPTFHAVVPSNADRYSMLHVFGMPVLQIGMRDNRVLLEIGAVRGGSRQEVQNSLEARYKPFLRNINVIGNRSLTTSNNVDGYFYAYEATGPSNNKVMMRAIFFEQGGVLVYQVMYLESSLYIGAVRDIWLRVVNEFEW